MAIPLALPLAPVISPGAAAGATTFAAGAAANIWAGVSGFRKSTPSLPPLTGRESEPTLAQKLEDYLAGARVPVGFPLPPPWRPEATALGGAIGLGLGLWNASAGLRDKLAQLWGMFNGPDRQTEGDPNAGDPMSPSGSFRFGGFAPDGEMLLAGRHKVGIYGPNGWANYPYSFTTAADSNSLIPDSLEWLGLYTPSSKPGETWAKGFTHKFYANGNYGTGSSGFAAVGGFPIDRYSLRVAPLDPVAPQDLRVLGVAAETVPWRSPITPTLEPAVPPLTLPPALLPAATPATEPAGQTISEPETGTAFLPANPLNGTWINRGNGLWTRNTTNPDGSTTTEWRYSSSGANGTSAASVPSIPATFPAYNPALPTQQTNPDGTLTELAPATIPATSPTQTIPWPGAAPITGTGFAPAATLVGIATEVGRIERKIDQMNTPPEGGDGGEGLRDLLTTILGALQALASETTYTLDSPCEVDANGDKLPPVEIEVPGALSSFEALANRMDALAQLIQVHKNLKQPNCRPRRPVGEFVTVNFEEV